SQSSTRYKSQTVTRERLSGVKPTNDRILAPHLSTRGFLAKSFSGAGPLRSCSSTNPSQLAVASFLPSGAKATRQTEPPGWKGRAPTSLPLATSHRQTLLLYSTGA